MFRVFYLLSLHSVSLCAFIFHYVMLFISSVICFEDAIVSKPYYISLKCFIFRFQKWTKDLKLVHSWQAHETVVYALVCDENRLFSSSSEGEVKEWDPKTGEFRQMTVLAVSFKIWP